MQPERVIPAEKKKRRRPGWNRSGRSPVVITLMAERPGDAAFRAQLVALLPRLRRFAHGLTRPADEGDDLVQAACERALERHQQWRPDTRLDSWLYRMIQTIWVDRLRSAQVRERYTEAVPADAMVVDGVRAQEASLTLAAVRRQIEALPAEQRAVLLLVCVEGQSYREAAEILGTPVGTVMSRLARARAALSAQTGGQTGTSRGARPRTGDFKHANV